MKYFKVALTARCLTMALFSLGFANSSMASVVRQWGEDDRRANIGDIACNTNNPNHSVGCFILIDISADGRYWYFPEKRAIANYWWYYVGSQSDAQQASDTLVWLLKNKRYRFGPGVGMLGDEYLSISATSGKIDVFALLALNRDGSLGEFPATGQSNHNWQYVESIELLDRNKTFDHAANFSKLPTDLFYESKSYFEDPQINWYVPNYMAAKYSGHQELLKRYDYHVPSGKGLTILQAESDHTPDNAGTVKHLFRNAPAGTHSTYISKLLNGLGTYPMIYTKYDSFTPGLTQFHTATTADLRTFMAGEMQQRPYPAKSIDGQAITAAKLLNISNTNGGSSGELLRQFDKFVADNDMVACTAQSSLSVGNATTSGMAYNSIVSDQYYHLSGNDSGPKINDHGSPRQKPDLVAHTDSYATSYAAPRVCSAAAVLLERANLDKNLQNASKNVVIKAILMAGATRFNYRATADFTTHAVPPLFRDGEWIRASDQQPLSSQYGAGALNINTAYSILDAGKQAYGSRKKSKGWHFADGLFPGSMRSYSVTFDKPSVLSVVVAWNRKINNNASASELPDYIVSVLNEQGTVVASSDTKTGNVELVEASLPAGSYQLKVQRNAADANNSSSYGIAWISKQRAPAVAGLKIDRSRAILTWDKAAGGNYRYRVQVGTENFAKLDRDQFVSTTSLKVDGADVDKQIRVIAYPVDSDVSSVYPSVPALLGNH